MKWKPIRFLLFSSSSFFFFWSPFFFCQNKGCRTMKDIFVTKKADSLTSVQFLTQTVNFVIHLPNFLQIGYGFFIGPMVSKICELNCLVFSYSKCRSLPHSSSNTSFSVLNLLLYRSLSSSLLFLFLSFS